MKRLIVFLVLICAVLSLCCCKASVDNIETAECAHDITKGPNCTQPKTCMLCGETWGERGEHDVEIGTCSECNEFRNKELYDDISGNFVRIRTAVDALCLMFSEESEHDVSVLIGATYDTSVSKLKDLLSETVEMCGDISELSSAKKCLESALESIPEKQALESDEAAANFPNKLNLAKTFVYDAAYRFTQIS